MDTTEIRSRFVLDDVNSSKEKFEGQLATAHTDPSVNISQLSQELNYYSTLTEMYSELYLLLDSYEDAKTLLESESDKEMIELALSQKDESEASINELTEKIVSTQIKYELADPDDSKSVVLEIRAGAGGDEAAIFAADLYRMYANYAGNMGWEINMRSSNSIEAGGYKEVIAEVNGKNVFEKLKYESGVHRVQRIPTTESGGRIHTSTASVAILPIAEEVDIVIKPEDIRVDVMRSSGAGGQSVNKTSSAVRITHLETGIIVSCQETKVQQKNKEMAMQVLRARLYEKEKAENMKKRSEMRSGQIGSGGRSEKIRTYNYPQSRITDHRIKKSWHNLEQVLGGDLEQLIQDTDDAMIQAALEEIQREKMS